MVARQRKALLRSSGGALRARAYPLGGVMGGRTRIRRRPQGTSGGRASRRYLFAHSVVEQRDHGHRHEPFAARQKVELEHEGE